jgi:hypothetical protein
MARTVLKICALFCLFLVSSAESCDSTPTQTKQTTEKLKNTEMLLERQPGTPINFSMDRFLLDERNRRFNNPEKTCYIYICFADGTWLKTTILGKLASTSKRLTRKEQLAWFDSDGDGTGDTTHLSEAPDEMAMWGSSDPAKVGMLSEGSLVEFGGGMIGYIYSEVPLNFSNLQKPMIELTIQANAEERASLQRQLQKLQSDFKKSQQN